MDYDAENKIVKQYIKDVEGKYSVSLTKRLFKFAIRAFGLLKTIRKEKDYDVFRYQLSKSATSIGANYEEAQGAFSIKEFASKIGICLKEARETNYFLLFPFS
ncbi:MAG: four helix bundle protein, partial [Calditrichia bacterium]|nr:four helix bundle protein [Calditrichia bacterium]